MELRPTRRRRALATRSRAELPTGRAGGASRSRTGSVKTEASGCQPQEPQPFRTLRRHAALSISLAAGSQARGGTESLASDRVTPGTVIVLEIDGVVNQLASRRPGTVPTRMHVEVRVGNRVRRLARSGEIVWAGSWDAATRAALAGTMGLRPDLRSVPGLPTDGDEPRTATPGLPAVTRWLDGSAPDAGWHAVVWIDDELYEDALRWAAARPYPVLLVRTDPVLGLAEADVARVEAFLADPERERSRVPGEPAA